MSEPLRRTASLPQSRNTTVDMGKIGDARLQDVPALADCSPGVEPTEYNVIIAPAEMAEKIGSLFIPDETRENRSLAMQVGRIIDASDIAFNYDVWPKGSRGKPGVGDVVWFARYAGGELEGADGRKYRIVKDKDIGGIIQRADHPLNG